jgi:predicted permease
VLIFAVLFGAANQIIAASIAKLRRYNVSLKNAFVNSVMFYNSGNIGIPLVTLIFCSSPFLINGKTPYLTLALTTQVVILVVQNITTNTLGFLNAGKGSMGLRESLRSILTMPILYAVPLAFILKALPFRLEDFPLWPALEYLKDGLISVALLTLGVQFSKIKFSLKNNEVYISNFVRLIGGPAVAFLLLWALKVRGVPAQTLMISSALPTAVNTALIAVERNNEPDFACQTVVSATLFSALTLVFVVYVSRIVFPV